MKGWHEDFEDEATPVELNEDDDYEEEQMDDLLRNFYPELYDDDWDAEDDFLDDDEWDEEDWDD